nr:pyridoxine 5'-phosphate synthase [candidate division Zixibacteria bacterium]
MPSVSIKVDYAASLRNIRGFKEPDPSHAAVIAEIAGADGICCHLREDRRHIRDRDIYILKEVTRTRFILQIAPISEMIERAIEVKPALVTLMPFCPDEAYIENGIDLEANRDQYAETAEGLMAEDIPVAYFIDPDSSAVKDAARVKAAAVELNTIHYATAKTVENADTELDRLDQMAQLAAKLGMTVRCGNGLNYKNIMPLIELGVFNDFALGHAVISRGLMVGLDRAVRELVEMIHRPVVE